MGGSLPNSGCTCCGRGFRWSGGSSGPRSRHDYAIKSRRRSNMNSSIASAGMASDGLQPIARRVCVCTAIFGFT